MKLLWQIKLDNEPRQMHSLFPPLIVGNVAMPDGAMREIAVVAGVSDNLFGIDVAKGTQIWRLHFDKTFQADPGGRRHALPRRPDGDASHRADGHARQVHDLCRVVGRTTASSRCGDGQGDRAARVVDAAQR